MGAYLRQRLGEVTGIIGLGTGAAALALLATGKIDTASFVAFISFAGTVFALPQAAVPVQGAGAVTDGKTPPVETHPNT